MRTLTRALIPACAAVLALVVWFGPMENAGIWQDGQIVDNIVSQLLVPTAFSSVK